MTKLPSLSRAKFLRAPSLQNLLAVLNGAGEARVAGGAVRNALLKIPVADVDIATTLPPDRVIALSKAAGFAAHPTGIEHGTVTVVVDHAPYEVTTLRRDVETDGRRAKVQYTDDWVADAQRRDFTMNALYCDARGEIYDFSTGYRDLLRKRVRFVGEPALRIKEDYLRILRFFRFHARFGKGVPDKAGLAACIRWRKGLDGLSAERIHQELLKLLAAPGTVATLKVMARGGILARILPYTEDWRVIDRLPPDPLLRLFVLARDPADLRSRLRLSNAGVGRLAALARNPSPTPVLRPMEQKVLLHMMGAEGWRDAVQLAWARSRAPLNDRAWTRLLHLPERWDIPAFPLTGHDLIASGMAPGPELGQVLRRLEDWWVASGFTASKAGLLARRNA